MTTTDHAAELRRHARKLAHPAGDTPAVMEQAAAEIERLTAQQDAPKAPPAIVAWHVHFPGCDGTADWVDLGASPADDVPSEAELRALVYARTEQGPR